MLQIVFFSTLLTFTFIESVKNRWTCNTSDGEITYSSCGRDLRDLYFNIHAEFKSSVIMPLRKEVLCHGADGGYSFCRVLKGETINTTVSFSFSFLKFPKGFYIFIAEAFSGGIEDSLFCCNITLELKNNFIKK
ncbi:lymphocyte antigen 96-like isoform X2 [Vombatus ursinus]|uniref:MD-2-related lipid-recognition domain-containing protein n=1 Tax=Vombatus ursinus TaxID=29139 RepID=A0A4X2LIV1_VOMUR|nr:lymphocyte antigen 96-like isoform X2 [Vombatus ursinus]XP_027732639.1 lymphocyte antigen 96-like isoform X2 [Vombatus ursinus]